MSGNTFGTILRLTTFGESHGPAVGGVLDGFPSRVRIDLDRVQKQLDRRRPGQSALVTGRNEEDRIEILSGVMDGISTGVPLAFIIRNKDSRSEDYDHLKEVYRPSHADYTYELKYGIRDHRGGGRSSARTMAPWVAAGALCEQLLTETKVTAYVSSVGTIGVPVDYTELDLEVVDSNAVRCPHEPSARIMEEKILQAKEEGDTLGGIITCVVQGCPPGLGEPQFSKLHADLAHAMFSINAVKGFEIGGGFSMSQHTGSEVNDPFIVKGDKIYTRTNHSGGIQGGISNGMDIRFDIAFKPVATIGMVQNTVNSRGEELELAARGRHDTCVVPRAVPIVESMTWLVLADHYLRNRIYQ